MQSTDASPKEQAEILAAGCDHVETFAELQERIAAKGRITVKFGIDPTGAMANGGFCDDTSGDDWSSASSTASLPLVGHSNAADSPWTAAYLQYCNRTTVRLYCFEDCG